MTNVEQFNKIAQELSELYEAKDKAYGSSFADTYKKLGLISAVTRISDKFNRLCNLATNPDIDNLGENLEDTLRDMASYCIMTVMELQNKANITPDIQSVSYVSPEAACPIATHTDSLRIKAGDKFKCIKTVIMDDNEVAYEKGYAYTSEMDGCITDNTGCIEHRWNGKFGWINEDGCWETFGNCYSINDKLFPEVTFENSPRKVKIELV